MEISPPSDASQNGVSGNVDLDPYHLFADLESCNVGFKNFHPMPVTQNGNKLSGQGEMGGVWEWTSSVLERVNGYEAGKLYPAYSSESPKIGPASLCSTFLRRLLRWQA